jgi:hypothetical protein
MEIFQLISLLFNCSHIYKNCSTNRKGFIEIRKEQIELLKIYRAHLSATSNTTLQLLELQCVLFIQ